VCEKIFHRRHGWISVRLINYEKESELKS